MASELLPALQLKDVYAIAQSVGEQFQSLIQQFGNTYLAELVNTVVGVLEHLETLVQDNQKLQARICKLLLNNDSLLKESEHLKAEAKKNDVRALYSSSTIHVKLISPTHSKFRSCYNNKSHYSLTT